MLWNSARDFGTSCFSVARYPQMPMRYFSEIRAWHHENRYFRGLSLSYPDLENNEKRGEAITNLRLKSRSRFD